MENLWKENTPLHFWKILEEIHPEIWQEAINSSLHLLKISPQPRNIDEALFLTLGEGQFGKDQFTIDFKKRIYYYLKPLIPRKITQLMRRIYSGQKLDSFPLGFPIEDRYPLFLFSVVEKLLTLLGKSKINYIHFWKYGKRNALALLHDIETNVGQSYVRHIVDIEEKYGFRSCFNFVLERYPLDRDLINELIERGFEVGIHGLNHDGKDLFSKNIFDERANKVNDYIKLLNCSGYKSPLTHRNPYWMQVLNIEYDTSFFDTDPYEPIPGGTMCIYPFFIGKFVELPYTLMQDYTYMFLLKHKNPDEWMNKVDFLQKYFGLISFTTHPDYLIKNDNLSIYADLLQRFNDVRETLWHALPKEVAAWWRKRLKAKSLQDLPEGTLGSIELKDGSISIQPISAP